MELEQARQALMTLQSKMSAYNHAMNLLSYDGATTAPSGTAANRGHTLGILSEQMYLLATGQETKELLSWLDAHQEGLTEKEKRMVFLLYRDLKDMEKIPMQEYIAHQELLVEADDVWHRAKETSDFELFRPCLEKIVDNMRRFAAYCDPDRDPYDHWLDTFEPGLDQKACDAFFSVLRSRLVPLLAKIKAVPQVDDSFLKGNVAVAAQEKLSHKLMALMGIDEAHCGLATTEHPFTNSFGSHYDVRITTHYMDDNFVSSMYSVIHEGGHALYEMGCAPDLAYTVLDGGVSMGIHESQSRFYENIIGRSCAYCETILPSLKELFPEMMSDVDAIAFYCAVNKVQPSLIRTEADEVTYSLHIMVRYELEKRLMHGELAVADLPGEWNRLYKEYLGVDVPDDKHGVLQDTHWSGGSIGYFPSYALGSAYGAQFIRKMKETVDVEECIRKGDFAPINEWNRENIWQYGCLIKPADLLEKVLGEGFDPTVYADYLEAKCKEIYHLD